MVKVIRKKIKNTKPKLNKMKVYPLVNYRKQKINRALREQVWIHRVGRSFEIKCLTPWCENIIDVFNFQCGHNIPESKGGATTLENLYPICSRCNNSMGNQYTFDEWKNLHKVPNSNTIIKQQQQQQQKSLSLLKRSEVDTISIFSSWKCFFWSK